MAVRFLKPDNFHVELQRALDMGLFVSEFHGISKFWGFTLKAVINTLFFL